MLKVRVGVLDQHEIARYGLCRHFSRQPELLMAGTYSDVDSALDSIEHSRLDVLLVGHLLHRDPSKVIQGLSKKYPRLKILALLNHHHPERASMLLTLGAHGVMYKTQPLQAYVDAVLSLARGERYTSELDQHADACPAPETQGLPGL